MVSLRQYGLALVFSVVSPVVLSGAASVPAQQFDSATVIRGIDASVKARLDGIGGYTVTEHYAIFRGRDKVHPVAEMTVKTDYRKETGKSYTILSESGSEILRRLVLGAILENEKRLNLPSIRGGTWLTSANYTMTLKPGGPQLLDGRECLVLAITPKRKAPNLLVGTLWVDAKDDSIVQIEGTASKSPSVFTGPTRMMRQYANVSGFAMATQARAVANSFLFGQTTVTIDYRNYQMFLQ